MTYSRHHPAPGRRAAGYSLIELIVSLSITIIVLLGLFQIFEKNTEVARIQTQVSDLQQSMRVAQNEMVRMIRMAGRGGLQSILNNQGVRLLPAVSVQDNVAADTYAVPGEPESKVVAGSDILSIRGVFTTPIYQINSADPTSFTLYDSSGVPTTNPQSAARGVIVARNPSPTGIPQNLQPLEEAISPPGGGTPSPEALILVSPIDERVYAVVELDPDNSSIDLPGSQITLAFKINSGLHTNEYRDLYLSGNGPGPVLPTALSSVATVGILEELRFFVRDPDPDPVPSLAVARVYPNTDVVNTTADDNAAALAIADGISELQIALGFDSDVGPPLTDINGDGEIDVVITETDNGEDDDWLFNAPGDDPNDSPWVPPWDDTIPGAPRVPRLYFVRLNTVARIVAPELHYSAPRIQRLENSPLATINTDGERRFRRQLLQTTIDLRNL
jgi:type II secretory pathway pseudopilin PulG